MEEALIFPFSSSLHFLLFFNYHWFSMDFTGFFCNILHFVVTLRLLSLWHLPHTYSTHFFENVSSFCCDFSAFFFVSADSPAWYCQPNPTHKHTHPSFHRLHIIRFHWIGFFWKNPFLKQSPIRNGTATPTRRSAGVGPSDFHRLSRTIANPLINTYPFHCRALVFERHSFGMDSFWFHCTSVMRRRQNQ